jgi:hypothetical protein
MSLAIGYRRFGNNGVAEDPVLLRYDTMSLVIGYRRFGNNGVVEDSVLLRYNTISLTIVTDVSGRFVGHIFEVPDAKEYRIMKYEV